MCRITLFAPHFKKYGILNFAAICETLTKLAQDYYVRKKNPWIRAEADIARTSSLVLLNSAGLNWYCQSRRDGNAD
jgi:hypothetical protein